MPRYSLPTERLIHKKRAAYSCHDDAVNLFNRETLFLYLTKPFYYSAKYRLTCHVMHLEFLPGSTHTGRLMLHRTIVSTTLQAGNRAHLLRYKSCVDLNHTLNIARRCSGVPTVGKRFQVDKPFLLHPFCVSPSAKGRATHPQFLRGHADAAHLSLCDLKVC